MLLLVAGVLLWSATHLFSSFGRQAREGLVARIGLNPYKGLFSLLIVASLVLIVAFACIVFGNVGLILANLSKTKSIFAVLRVPNNALRWVIGATRRMRLFS